LFEEVLDKDYTKEDYIEQFTLRIPENLAKIERVVAIYRTKVPDTPYILFEVLEEQRQRLKDARTKYGDYVPPGVLAKG
jgi:phosphoenolpyruvate carboxykinase (GTP)